MRNCTLRYIGHHSQSISQRPLRVEISGVGGKSQLRGRFREKEVQFWNLQKEIHLIASEMQI